VVFMSRSLALAATLTVIAVALASTALASGTTTKATAFPVTVTAANGKVTVAKRPTRIVSLSPTSTESLFAIGAGRQVIAVDDQSDYPRTAPRTRLSGYTPNVEAIAAYRPDLVVVASDPKDLVASLVKLGIPVVHHNAATTIRGAYQQIRQLGALTGRAQAAAALVARMKRQIARVVAKRRSAGSGASVYHELDPTFFSATSSTFVGRVYALFGLKNIADAAPGGSDYPQLSPEFIVASSPDLIVLADSVCCGQTAETVAARPGWSGIEAVRNRSILRIDDSIASRWGPRLVNFVRAVGTALGRLGR
jgi:iron complex transport system substrate-binding protein